MKVVVPAAGAAKRFVQQGYTVPKPLVQVNGKPLIKWATDSVDLLSSNEQLIFLVRREHIESHGIDQALYDLYSKDIAVIPVDGTTEGAACTVLLAKELINSSEEMIILNSDVTFKAPLREEAPRWQPQVAGIITTFESHNPRFSYARVDDAGYVTQVAEKEPISDRATVGVYYFSRGDVFVWAAERMIRKNIRVNNEFYVAPVYNELIDAGHKIKAIESQWHVSLGTPEEIDEFVRSHTLLS